MRRLLLDNADLRRFWVASTASSAGNSVSYIAVPLTAAVTLGAGPLEVGALSALTWAPSLFLSMHIGALADRIGRRRNTMIIADVARAVLLFSVWISFLADSLTLIQLFFTVFLVGSLTVLSTVNENSVFVSLVPRDRYVEGQAMIQFGHSAAFLIGPLTGGLITSLWAPPAAVLANALCLLGSAILLSRIPAGEAGPPAHSKRVRIRDGLRFIAINPPIRVILSVAATTNLFETMFSAMVVLYLTQQVHMSATTIGFTLAAGAAGGVLASIAAPRLVGRLGLGNALLAAVLLSSLPLLAVPLTSASAVVIIASVAAGFGGIVQDIGVGTAFSALVPDDVRATVRGAFTAVSFGMRPLGGLAGGFLASQIGLAQTLVVAVAGGAASVLWLAQGRIRAVISGTLSARGR